MGKKTVGRRDELPKWLVALGPQEGLTFANHPSGQEARFHWTCLTIRRMHPIPILAKEIDDWILQAVWVKGCLHSAYMPMKHMATLAATSSSSETTACSPLWLCCYINRTRARRSTLYCSQSYGKIGILFKRAPATLWLAPWDGHLIKTGFLSVLLFLKLKLCRFFFFFFFLPVYILQGWPDS